MRHCCLSSGRNTPFTTPFLIHLETVARSTFKSFATSEAFKKAFIHLQYKLSKKLSRGQTVACVASINKERGVPGDLFPQGLLLSQVGERGATHHSLLLLQRT